MKTKLSLIPIIFITLFTLSSCIITSRDINVQIDCDQFNTNNHVRNDFRAEVGDKIRIKLCSNPSTGFQWEYTMSEEGIVKEEDHDFEEPKGDAIGTPGMETWTFEAVEEGTTELFMAYGQPWEGGEKDEWTYTISVVVE